jgi:hypothetical protein
MVKKNFDSALEYLLYTEYRFLGGKRVVKMIVNDVEGLIKKFIPALRCFAWVEIIA